MTDLKQRFPQEAVELWVQDEARFGLQPVLRRVWAKRGVRPQAVVEPKYEWLWLYAAANVQTGEVFWLLMPHLNGEMVQLFVEEFARHVAGAGKRLVMLWDGAAAHRAKRVQMPERLSTVQIPAYSPELNPAERLWPLVKEGIANRCFSSLDELEETVCQRCQKLNDRKAEIATRLNYHWLAEM